MCIRDRDSSVSATDRSFASTIRVEVLPIWARSSLAACNSSRAAAGVSACVNRPTTCPSQMCIRDRREREREIFRCLYDRVVIKRRRV